MKKILTILCLSVVCVNLGFASDLSSDEQTKLTNLKLRATHFFEQGKREQERLARIEILKIQQNFENLRLAVQLCIVGEKFTAGESLLDDYCPDITICEAKNLRDYLQDAKIKFEQRDIRAQRPNNLFFKLLLTLKCVINTD